MKKINLRINGSINGKEVDRRELDRPLGGKFTRLHIGHKPGNWRTLARIKMNNIKLVKRSN